MQFLSAAGSDRGRVWQQVSGWAELACGWVQGGGLIASKIPALPPGRDEAMAKSLVAILEITEND